MPFDVRVVFSGACVIVNDGEEQVKDYGTRFTQTTILLPDLRKGPSVGKYKLNPHRPLLVIRTGEGSFVEIPLDRQEITFSFDGEPMEGVVALSQPEGRQFSLVPDLRQIHPAYSEVEPRAFSDQDSAGLVAARVVARSGYLVAADLDHAENVVFAGSPEPTFRQPRLVAHRYALCFPHVGSFEIWTRDMDGDDEPHSRFKITSGHLATTLHLGNYCASDVAGIVEPWLWMPASDGDCDYDGNSKDIDFAAAYLLSRKGIPDPLVLPETKGGGGSGPKCRNPIMARSVQP